MKKIIYIKLSVLFLVFVFPFILPRISFAQTASDIQTQIAALLAEVQKLQVQLAQIQETSVQWCHTFSANLMTSKSGAEITALQTALQKDGESIIVTDSFDDQTASAVTGFQEKYASDILAPNGLKNGTGYAGPSTRAKLNSLYGCGTASTIASFDIATNSLLGGTVGVSYSSPLAGSGGSGSYAWSASGLPPGLKIVSASEGLWIDCVPTCPPIRFPATISGIPMTAGTYTVTIQLQSGTQTVSKQFSLVIAAQ